MSEFEDKVRAAFDAELNRAPARPGLRQRVIANAVSTPRTRPSWFSLFLSPPRMALVGAAAAVLILAGIGVRIATFGTSNPSSGVLAFGKLPAASLHPEQGLGAGPGATETMPYFGPATLSWSGQLPQAPASAPVYRFALPSTADLDTFASRLGAKPTGTGATPGSRTYSGPDGYQMFIGPNPLANEPVFILNREPGPGGTQPLGEAKARAAADAELARLGLTPSWKAAVQVHAMPTTSAQPLAMYDVSYQRLVQVSPTVTAGEVDGNGDPSGIRVTVDSSGKVLMVTGVVRLAERGASYPLRAPTSALIDAMKMSATPGASIPPKPFSQIPAVALTRMTLVYTAVRAGANDYLEPAYLFTGDFTVLGAQWQMRLLIPAVAARGLS